MKKSNTILDKILENSLQELSIRKQKKSLKELMNEVLASHREHRDFGRILKNRNTIDLPALIAEIKRASPSAGIIQKEFNLEEISKIYETSSFVKVISVITEEKFFTGKPQYLKNVKELTTKPLLRKDFIVDEYQIYESILLQADAILLIAKCLEREELKQFTKLAYSLNLEVLVEVHNLEELENALNAEAKIIGINSRNLTDFSINLNLLEELIPQIPNSIIKVAESGIKNYSSLLRARDAGADAVLVGTLFMESENPAEKINELFLNLKGVEQ